MWLPKWLTNMAINMAIYQVAEKLREQPLVVAGLKEYQSGGTAMSVSQKVAEAAGAGAGAVLIANEVMTGLRQRPLRDLAERYGAAIKIPDFDNDPSNDVGVMEVVGKIVKAVVAASFALFVAGCSSNCSWFNFSCWGG